MLNLFKRQWLPGWIRECMLQKFPKKFYRIEFDIAGRRVGIDDVVGNERRVNRMYFVFVDSEGNSIEKWVSITGVISYYEAVDIPTSFFAVNGIEPEFRPNVKVGKKAEVEKMKEELKLKLSEIIDYCRGSLLDRTNDYPFLDLSAKTRRLILDMLLNMSENSVPVFIKFDLDNVALDQLEVFKEELKFAEHMEEIKRKAFKNAASKFICDGFD